MTSLSKPAARLDGVQPSPIRKIFDRAAAIEAQGTKVYHFEIGRPDFDTPQVAKAAASAALERGEVHYGPNAGTLPLRRAITDYLSERRGTDYDPVGGVLVTVGAGEALFLAFMAYIGPGDEVIYFTPAWANYDAAIRLTGATPVPVALDPANGYRFDVEALGATITDRTRMIVVCTPNNPTGGVLTGDDIAGIERALARTDILLVTDEIYADLVYGDVVHESPAAREGLYDRTIVIGGFAKAFAMDGWRLGWLAAPNDLVTPCLRVRQYTTVCPPTFLQPGAAAALTEAAAEAEAMRRSFEGRRAAGLEILSGVPGVHVAAPDGAFYFYVTYDEGVAEPAEQLAMRLLEEHHVALVPGTAFDPRHGQHSFRVSYATDIDDLREGLRRIVAVLTASG